MMIRLAFLGLVFGGFCLGCLFTATAIYRPTNLVFVGLFVLCMILLPLWLLPWED